MNADDLPLLLSWTMPYGKYQGRAIADLPGDYLNWFARQGFPPGKLGQLLALMHELDHNGLSSLLDPLRQKPTSQVSLAQLKPTLTDPLKLLMEPSACDHR